MMEWNIFHVSEKNNPKSESFKLNIELILLNMLD